MGGSWSPSEIRMESPAPACTVQHCTTVGAKGNSSEVSDTSEPIDLVLQGFLLLTMWCLPSVSSSQTRDTVISTVAARGSYGRRHQKHIFHLYLARRLCSFILNVDLASVIYSFVALSLDYCNEHFISGFNRSQIWPFILSHLLPELKTAVWGHQYCSI